MQADRRTAFGLAAAGAAAVLVMVTMGVALATSGSPSVSEKIEGAPLTGGAFVIIGIATNSGKVDAPNVAVAATITGLNLTATAQLGGIAAGQSQPYSVTIPIGPLSVPAGVQATTRASWDQPSLDLRGDQSKPGYQNGHGVVAHTGSVHNAGKAVAPKVTLEFTASTDAGGANKVATAGQAVGDVPAGGDVPYSVTIDLGANPPSSWFTQHAFKFEVPAVDAAPDFVRRVGGTLTVSGHLRNDGRGIATAVEVTRTAIDGHGRVLAAGRAEVGNLGPGGLAVYAVSMDLGTAVVDEVVGLAGRVDFGQTQFVLIKTRSSTRLPTTSWGS